MKDASIAFNLLTTDDATEAAYYVEELEQLNLSRQRQTEELMNHVRTEAQLRSKDKVILVSGDNWPEGIIGLVAGKLSEEINRPVLVLSRGPEVSRGSARSQKGLNIIDALGGCADILVRYGGHAQAAGFTIANNHIEKLREHFLTWNGQQNSPRVTKMTGKTEETKETAARSEEAGKAGAVDPKAGQPKVSETKASPEESSWRDQVAKARDRAKELQRAAEEAELRITTLRNELGVSGQSSRYRNETAAELDQAGQRLATMQTQARAAADDLTQLVEYGRQKAFTEGAETKPTEEGKPNESYYRTQFAKFTEALESAQRRIQLYDNRVRDLSQQMTTNSGGKDKAGHRTGGDGYFGAQLQKDRDEAQQKLDEARTALTKAQTDLDALRDEARRAGVPPGVFR
jgi:hypothetical protein